MAPKYSLPEIERRWLVDLSLVDLDSLPKPVSIVDRYLMGTRLRLRKMDDGGNVIYKFVKKYGREDWVEPITNLYLDRAEYEALSQIPAKEIWKRRYRIEQGSLDVFDGGELAIFEKEFESVDAAASFSVPQFVTKEILEEPDHIWTSAK